MLIEALANLAERAGATRISLEIPPSAGGNCAVMVVTSLGHDAKVSDDEEHARLLAAISGPLVVEGNVGELDGRLVSLIDNIEDSFTEASNKLPETDAQRLKRKLKEASEKKAEKGKGGKKAKSVKTEDKMDESGESEDEHDDALASGEADSL